MMLDRHHGLLQALESRGQRRVLMPARGVDFASNDYLGLAGSDLVRDLALQALQAGVPAGAGAARLLRGNHPALVSLEQEAAAHFGTEAALYFGAGYAANLALAAALPAARDLVLHDALIHASLHDGLRLGTASARAFAHNDVAAAEAALLDWRREGGRGQVWIAVETLYSMDGDFAPLAEFAALAARHDAFLMLDEAHASGIWGPEGRGLSQPFAGAENVISLHTCGKALGVQGALVCGPRALIETLVNRGRSFIYSTAPSPLCAEILRGVLCHLATDPGPRERLKARVARLAGLAARLGLPVPQSQIMALPAPGEARALARAAALQSRGFDLRAIRAPTVPKGAERLRLSLTLNPDEADLNALFAAITDLWET